MDFFSSLAKSDESKPSDPDQHQKPSNFDLFNSAKLVAEAAQAQLGNEPEKYDKGKVAAAAADLLGGASDYGKLDETKGVGKYVDQAEDYLRQYGTSHCTTTATTTTTVAGSGEEKTTTVAASTTVTTEPVKHYTESDAGSHIKKAEGFLNKPSGKGETGGSADFMNLAGDFLNKPSSGGGEEGGASGFMKLAGDFIKK
ncbi:uncharacterized protein [Primulina eburnea]|uniref:uncharacterized protein n=1 Tax=Primulina eburnea TaxID=1245227 RepID=UPI003C6C4315